MLSCLVIDDEPLAIDVIAAYIPRVPFLKLAGTYTNPVDALIQLQKERIDLIFLDIQMPQLSGLQFMDLLQSSTQVVIVSAYNEFALQGFEHDVTDYLLKPVSFERFLKSAEKALRLSDIFARDISTPMATVTPPATPDFIFVRAENKIIKVNFNDILYVEGLKNYISIYLVDNKRIITLQNMKALEEVLPTNRFVRVQKSYIVNLEKIDSIERQRIFIGNNSIPIGEAFATNFFSIIGNMGR
jgi:two-component system LytT family response regulator